MLDALETMEEKEAGEQYLKISLEEALGSSLPFAHGCPGLGTTKLPGTTLWASTTDFTCMIAHSLETEWQRSGIGAGPTIH